MNIFETNNKLNEFNNICRKMIDTVKLADDSLVKRLNNKFIDTLANLNERMSDDIRMKGALTLFVIHNRIIKEIVQYKKVLNSLIRQADNLGTILDKYFKQPNKHEKFYKLKDEFEHIKDHYKELEIGCKEILKAYIPKPEIMMFLLNASPINKNDFLSLFPLIKDKIRNDGSRLNWEGTNEARDKLPDIINGDVFRDFIFSDIVLCTNIPVYHFYSDYSYGIIKRSGFDIFEKLQEIAGKPIQSYTATQDEFGNIIEMKQNKPNLKLI